mgnify:CR=1 FL=1
MANIKIKRFKSNPFKNKGDLDWSEKEFHILEKRVLNLRDDQIGLLALLVAGFYKDDLRNIVKDIRSDGTESIHLSIIICEAESKDELLWWLDYFEEFNKR